MKKMKIWGTACVGTKGQVVIPAKARETYNINEGDQLLVVSAPNNAGILMVKAEELEKMLSEIQHNITKTMFKINKNKLK